MTEKSSLIDPTKPKDAMIGNYPNETDHGKRIEYLKERMDTKKENTLLIIAAGEATRMGSFPKAISLIKGKPNLYNTVEKAYEYFDKIYVFSLDKYVSLYEEVIEPFADKCQVRWITSGKGCGDAVLMALKSIETFQLENLVVMWGDVYIVDKKIFEELLDKPMVSSMLFPVVLEKNPYVWFKHQGNSDIILATTAMFSKREETVNQGYHDQSIFRINTNHVTDALVTMKNVLWKNDNYMNGELQFLDIVHYLFNTRGIVQMYETEYVTMSYNTHGELLDINKRLM